MIDLIRCPIDDCPTEANDADLYNHLLDDHHPSKLITFLGDGEREAPRPPDRPVCEWNPATASPACDHDPNCPVHGQDSQK